MKKICVMFVLVMMSSVVKPSQAPENPKNSNASAQQDPFLLKIISKTTLPNGDVRIEYADGTYETIVAWRKS